VADSPQVPPAPATYALLSDGSTVEIRAAQPGDAGDIRRMHEQMSPGNSYFRFFSFSPQAPEREAKRLCRPSGPDHAALLARLGGRLVGVASYEPTARPGIAEIAFAVSDEMHGRGVATLLLEHLVSLARQRRLTAFAAETLPENVAMQRVFADAGLHVERRFTDGVIELVMPLPDRDSQQLDSYLDAVAGRASRADVASLRHLLQPSSVAVIGASRSRGTAGREILHNIVTGGFGGAVYAVNPAGGTMAGVSWITSPAALPAGLDLAVVAVPPAEVTGVAEQCGRRGVRALIVVTAGLGDRGAELLAICRRYGMRLVGPNCFGVIATPARLNATFGSSRPLAGTAGLVVQSGGIGIALLEHFSRLGIGLSSFASAGDKYDVSSNDLLTWWEQDELTSMAVLHVESFGNPRAFARTARRLGQRMPVLTVIGGRSAAGQRAAAGNATGSTTSLVKQEALFGQAGIIATRSLGELVEATAFLSCQQLPAGRRVAIVSNAGGAGVLAADACGESGLTVAVLAAGTQQRLAALLPSGAAVSGPVDTTATVTAANFRACLELAAADPGVDAVLAIGVPTAVADPAAAILTAAVRKPLAAALLDQAESVRLRDAGAAPGRRGESDLPGGGLPADDGDLPAAGTSPAGRTRIPAYGFPESAARALAHAAAYREWRDREHGRVPALADLEPDRARAAVADSLAVCPAGGWLSAAPAGQLLASYGIQVAVSGPGTARATGAEVQVRVVQEPVFGPVVVFGLAGVATELLGDHSARLAPLTDVDAAVLIRAVRAAPALLGQAGAPAVNTGALADLLIRVSVLADDLPEVAELDLSPVIASPGGVLVAGARIRLAPAAPRDPFLRQLR
jgi:acyl-CoA synthetase (NDP forming)/RimJ/RimL family protein N-acetyltransferase